MQANWTRQFAARDVPGGLPRQSVGVASALGTIPSWRVITTLGWSLDSTHLTATARYASSYRDTWLEEQTGHRVASQTLVDAQLSHQFGRFNATPALLRGCTVTMGAMNLFDRAPPFATVSAAAGYDLSQGDLRQRFVYVRISKRF